VASPFPLKRGDGAGMDLPRMEAFEAIVTRQATGIRRFGVVTRTRIFGHLGLRFDPV
jgi:hypothetical protein